MRTTETIRTIFLHPSQTYSVCEAAALLGIEDDDLCAWMEVGEIEGVRQSGDIVIEWSELVSFAIDFWSQEVVEEALGPQVAAALPELLRLAELTVRIPHMQVAALKRVAAKCDERVSTVLARELCDFVSAHAEWLSAEIPGLEKALAWPDRTEQAYILRSDGSEAALE